MGYFSLRNALQLTLVLSLQLLSNSILAKESENAPVRVQSFCVDVETATEDSAFNWYSPEGVALRKLGYVRKIARISPELQKRTTTRVLVTPQHGQIVPSQTPNGNHVWIYRGNRGYQGRDMAVFLVEIDDKQAHVAVNFLVHDVVPESSCEVKHCPVQEPACRSLFPNDPKS